MKKRIFIALDPPKASSAALAAVRVDAVGVRWIREENLHLTMEFLGHVAQDQLERLVSRLETITSPPVRLEFSGFSCFPSLSRPRVLCALMEPNDALVSLAHSLRSVCIEAGFELRSQPFRPHITVARLKSADRAWVRWFVETNAITAVPGFTAESFRIYESLLRPSGAEYRVLHSIDLAE